MRQRRLSIRARGNAAPTISTDPFERPETHVKSAEETGSVDPWVPEAGMGVRNVWFSTSVAAKSSSRLQPAYGGRYLTGLLYRGSRPRWARGSSGPASLDIPCCGPPTCRTAHTSRSFLKQRGAFVLARGLLKPWNLLCHGSLQTQLVRASKTQGQRRCTTGTHHAHFVCDHGNVIPIAAARTAISVDRRLT